MKKWIYTIVFALCFSFTACEDYLNVNSPSNVDEDFVFSDPREAYKVLMSCYEILRANSNIHSNGLFYEILIGGSDSETHPEGYSAQMRHIPEGLYATEITIDYSTSVSAWNNLYRMANRLAIVVSQIETKPGFQEAWAARQVSDWTQLYGEAVTLRAIAYHELARFFGDIPYFDEPIYTTAQTDKATCISRYYIYDRLLEDLQKVEPYMYRLGEGGIGGERISRTFVQGFIGRIALYAGGYSLCRTDFDYGDVSFDRLGSEKWNAKYVRRTDYRKYYELAKTYLDECVTRPGSARLIVVDERIPANPFQRHFQYQMDLTVSPESLFEIAETQGVQTERPYAFGRPSTGGGSNAYPCKSYGQSRIHPSFYYGDYNDGDLRRDASVTVTGSSGAATEELITLEPGSGLKGGLSNNKWDENRMNPPFTARQRQSGINTTYMRMSDVILMLAEVKAELGDESGAKTELTKVRERAFAPAYRSTAVTEYINSLSGNDLKEAIAQERKLEFAGEGLRRYDLIRTGKLPEKIVELRHRQEAMVNGLSSQGYYTFPNGHTISKYIWTKKVNTADLGMNTMLTGECNVAPDDPAYPVKFPGWRGQYDNYGNGAKNTSGNRSLAIQGLFEYIDPAGPKAVALEAAGYTRVNWGQSILNNLSYFTSDLFKGYPDEYLSAGIPPRYMMPMGSETILQSKGLITNGYGFSQE
ncbi:MAG: RagB/SusD family nutrient uptake outer membrane protein [Dysgonamonadaceae bacterium]|jgi:hypothetical protein|nr:RagB/SusD family nutrient uptake outer membrane protein [Dysgonamonadaceae bacterium]